jgi:hypothetical protein
MIVWMLPCRSAEDPTRWRDHGLLETGDHNPIVAPVRHRQAEEFGVAGGQGSRVGAVDDYVVHASDHGRGPGTRPWRAAGICP